MILSGKMFVSLTIVLEVLAHSHVLLERRRGATSCYSTVGLTPGTAFYQAVPVYAIHAIVDSFRSARSSNAIFVRRLRVVLD